MSAVLPPGQARCLEVFRGLHAQGRCPSIRDVCAELGFTSPAGVHQHFEALERKGFMMRDSNGASRSRWHLTSKGLQWRA